MADFDLYSLPLLSYTDLEQVHFDTQHKVWRIVKSSYVSPDGKRWHVHPELVRAPLAAGDSPTVTLCHLCSGNVNSKRPPLSIAAGKDVGDARRLGLTTPSLLERALLCNSPLMTTIVCTSTCM